MGKTPEQQLILLEEPSIFEVRGLAQRNRKTSEFLDLFSHDALDGSNNVYIPLKNNVEAINPLIPHELTEFLDAFKPQASSMNYRLEFSRNYPKLSLIIARGMEDVASVQVWNKTPEIGVSIENNWSRLQQIGDAQKKLGSMLQQGDAYQKRVNHLNMGLQIMLLAIRSDAGLDEPITSAPWFRSPEDRVRF